MSTRRLFEIAFATTLLVSVPVDAFAEEPSAPAPSPAPSHDPLDPYRERFKGGLEKYKEGRYAEAIVVWEAIYREIGPDHGYRLAFNLGRAFDKYGDSTRAAELYESYRREVEKRRNAGQAIEENVEKQEADARLRLSELASTMGRIRVASGDRPTAVRIDGGETRLAGFTAYVAPGKHTVTFEAGGKDVSKTEIDVKEGEVVDLAPAPLASSRDDLGPGKPLATETRLERPFSGGFVLATGVLAAVSLAIPVIVYANAWEIRNDYEAASTRAEQIPLQERYDSAKSAMYGTLAIPLTLGVATAGLALWWVLGSKETNVPVTPGAGSFRVTF